MRRATLSLLLTIAVIAPAARAQQTAPAAAKQGIWSYVDAGTLAVGRLDLSAYDRGTFEKWLTDVLKANVKDPQTVDAVTQGLHQGVVLSYPDQLKQAGAKEVYGVLSLSAIPNTAGWLVVPVPGGADADKIARACFPPGFDPKPAPAGGHLLTAGSAFATVVGDAVIFSAGSPDRFKQFAAADRPDLAAALAAAGKVPLAVGVSPNDDTRKVIEQMMPQLPPPASVPSTVVTRGLKYASVGMDFPPKPKLDAVVQCGDPAAATALHDVVVRLLGIARQDRSFRQTFPTADRIVDTFTPKVDGDRLVLSLDPAGVDRLASFFAAGVTRARDNQRRLKSMSNLRQLGQGIILYRNEHQGAFPDRLEQLVPYFTTGRPELGKPEFDRTMVNPLHPERKQGYVYVKPAGDPQETGPETAVAYESFDQWPGQVAVLFADGHVEAISDQHRFEHLLDEAKNPKHK